ncbi:hypothetical protein PGT21_006850 [Puccinia graminis f. sp. tritici]|uniref:Uncharacterized protein n=1 Tax=Puccinia graminis f. sp. tritici TaxID=56615 RepID=A0A5B0PWZ1_PUCGR|nr:hypothetical protein PGT21_006850 [Puccinia graminis f. sp. tritici]
MSIEPLFATIHSYLSRKRVNELLSKLWTERGMDKLCFLSRPRTKTNGRFIKDFQLRLVDLLLVKSTPVTFRDHPGKIDFLRPVSSRILEIHSGIKECLREIVKLYGAPCQLIGTFSFALRASSRILLESNPALHTAISEISAIRLTRVDLCDLYLIGALAQKP